MFYSGGPCSLQPLLGPLAIVKKLKNLDSVVKRVFFLTCNVFRWPTACSYEVSSSFRSFLPLSSSERFVNCIVKGLEMRINKANRTIIKLKEFEVSVAAKSSNHFG